MHFIALLLEWCDGHQKREKILKCSDAGNQNIVNGILSFEMKNFFLGLLIKFYIMGCLKMTSDFRKGRGSKNSDDLRFCFV